jgi:ribosomal-protein-alanine N-acetyltransferase
LPVIFAAQHKLVLTLNFSPFPVLTTQRLRLRQISAADQIEMLQLRSDERVMRYIDRPRAKSIDDAMELIQKMMDGVINNESITWAITNMNDDHLIGSIGYWRIMKEHYRAEIGYMLHPNFHGKGLMQEAISAVIDFGFNDMKLHSIEANVNTGNEASQKLLEKNRFVREAFFKENFYFEGKFLDTFIYSLLTPHR